MAKWFITAKRADFAGIGQKFGISPVLARLIRNRDIILEDDIQKYLTGTIEDLYDPFLLKGIKETVVILAGKIAEGALTRVIGDYDVDGICAAHILSKGLNKLSGNVDAVIPHRMKDGYGLSDNLIKTAHADGINTIITCDNGIAAAAQIKLAKELGMTVIVTDHHEVPFTSADESNRTFILPPADAIVDPKQPDCPYPFKQICGAMVALKVIEALFTHMNVTMTDELRDELRCLAAIATVCDVMELTDENRILVQYGLKHLKECANIGVRSLIEVNAIGDKKLSAYHLGFIIGPCLNATGRLDTAERALSLLSATEKREAMNIAADLKELNESRKEMTKKELDKAILLVEKMFHEQDTEAFHGENKAMDAVLVLFLPDCHESLAGIIAGRIRERFCRPTFILTKSEEEIKGSGRSIDAYDMYEEICKCKDLFTKFGGHKMAAGLSMQQENIAEFHRRLNEQTILTKEDFEEKIQIDIALPLSYVNPKLIKEIEYLEPFGAANPKPVFAQKDVSLLSGRIMGKSGRAAKYKVLSSEGTHHEILYFGEIADFDTFLTQKFGKEKAEQLYKANNQTEPMNINITYYPDIAVYKGNEEIRIVMHNFC
ncbi:MAG: single-stranded-DNA-specific exonuclease RecJ [Lachnospiraceae bacterium]|nr:single-stranded-DNA-specific exonuclease RecJ [Lachnospiraceae bacterium]